MSTLVFIGFIGGLITAISPCILPVLPVIFFAGGDPSQRQEGAVSSSEGKKPFAGVRLTGVNLVGSDAQPISALKVSSGAGQATSSRWRPYLVVAGLVLSFTLFTLLGATILSWLHLPQDFMFWLSVVLLILIGVAMLIPGVMELLERPFARFGKGSGSNASRNGFMLGLVLGAAYFPCAGPVLTVISIAGSTGQIGWDTVVLAVSFAAGTAIPLLFFALAGRHVTRRLAAFRRHETLIRTLAGVSMLLLAVGMIFNLPAVLQRWLPDWTAGAQKATHSWLTGEQTDAVSCVDGAEALGECGQLHEFAGISQWLNSDEPVSVQALRGKVVLLDFWSYSCINCQKTLPVIQQLHEAYKGHGLAVVSIHSPEYAFEKETRNVQSSVDEFALTFPVGIDSDLETWKAYDNAYWPSLHLADAQGQIRYFKYGEGLKGLLEQHIRTLLRESDPNVELPEPLFSTADDEAAPRTTHTVLGYEGGRGFVAGNLPQGVNEFSYPAEQGVDTFALQGVWNVEERQMSPAGGRTSMRIQYFGTHVSVAATGQGTILIRVDGQDIPVDVNGQTALPVAAHNEAVQATAELIVPEGVRITELEILGNVCGNGKCGGNGPEWAFNG